MLAKPREGDAPKCSEMDADSPEQGRKADRILNQEP